MPIPPRLPPRPRDVVPLFEKEETPTDAGARSTKRPPSRPEVGETDRLLGELMASQARLEAAWDGRSREHETSMREVTSLGKCVRDLREDVQTLLTSQAKTTGHIKVASRLAPGVLVIVEVLRMIASHYIGGNS